MTAAPALVRAVHEAGAEIVWMRGAIKLVGDYARVSPELRAQVRANRDALLDYLRPHPCVGCGRYLFRDPGQTCYWCQRRLPASQP